MARFLLLLLFPLASLAQSGRYHVNTINTQTDTGYVTITDYFLRIERDSIQVLPVIHKGEDKDRTYYILEGEGFRGAGIFYPTSSRNMGGGCRRYYFCLFIEIRAKRNYTSTVYSIYYDE